MRALSTHNGKDDTYFYPKVLMMVLTLLASELQPGKRREGGVLRAVLAAVGQIWLAALSG